MCAQPTQTCRIFISRNGNDRIISEKIRDRLQELSGNLEFFDDGDIEAGEGWRERLRRELQRANLLLLLLTKPSEDDFDWPLYEAGLFEPLDQVDHRRVVCIYPDPQYSTVVVPSQLADRQAVKATENSVLQFLLRLFKDKNFTNTTMPLNKHLTEERLRPLAGEIANMVNEVETDRLSHEKFGNYYIQILLSPDVNSLAKDVEIESNDRSLQHLFGLGESPPRGRRWTWGEITGDLEEFNRRWAAQLEDAVAAIKAGRFFRQLTSMFLADDGKVYQPGIEIYRKYETRRMKIDVCFSEQIQSAWLQTVQPQVALAVHVELASRIHYELIEPFLRKISHWNTKSKKKKGCAEISKKIDRVEHYGHFIGQLTGSKLDEVLSLADPESEQLEEYEALGEEYDTKIRPSLQEALNSQSVSKLRSALLLWKKYNLSFLRACIHRCEAMLTSP